jgi:peptide/nickel transport system substrate-binding protein
LKMKWIKPFISLLTIFSVVLLGACGKSSSSVGGTSSSNAKTMFLGLVNPPVSFNPINSSDLAAQVLEKFMFDTFLVMDSPLHFVPKLADSFDTTDNQTFTIKLNKDAKWSDGKPVTTDDVAFTLNLVANPKVETSVGSYLTIFAGLDKNGKLMNGDKEIPSVKIIDAKTIQFKTKKPVDPNMVKEQLGSNFMILPKHVLKDVDPATLSNNPFMMKPTVTNGAFKFVEYKKDQYIQYAANTNYYLGKPKLSKMFVKIMPASNMVAQLQTGELDMNVGGGIGKIPAEDFATVQKITNVKTKFEQTYGFQEMMFNTEHIKDAKVRQAIAYAIDRPTIVKKLLKGHAEIVDGPYTSVNPYLDKNLEKYTYDPNKAKQLLKDAGWDFSKPLNLVVPTGNTVREQSADIITQNLEAVGLKVNTTKYDFPTIMQKGKNGDFDLLLMGFTNTIDPDLTTDYSSNGTLNFMRYKSAKTDQLLQEGKAQPNSDARKKIYNQLQETWEKDVPAITLYSDQDFSAVSNRVQYGQPKVFGFQKDTQNWALNGAN